MKKAFTLIEMLVVIAIIVILMAAMVGAYSRLSASAQRTKCKELVDNTATALTQLFQKEGAWPKALRSRGSTDGELDEKAAYPLAKGGYMTLTTDGTKLSGYDKFGVITPWAQAVVKRRGSSASLGDPVPCTTRSTLTATGSSTARPSGASRCRCAPRPSSGLAERTARSRPTPRA